MLLLVALFGVWLMVGCGEDVPEKARFILPEYGDACEGYNCSDVGECVWADGGAPYCECITGYMGAHCESCDAGFHRDAAWHCVPDRRCDDQPHNPCGEHGDCTDDDGVIACSCEQGYQGVRCNQCASGYVSNDKSECLKMKGTSK